MSLEIPGFITVKKFVNYPAIIFPHINCKICIFVSGGKSLRYELWSAESAVFCVFVCE